MVKCVIIHMVLNKQTGVYRSCSLMWDASAWRGCATVDIFDGTLNSVRVSEYVQSSRKIIAASTGNERKLV